MPVSTPRPWLVADEQKAGSLALGGNSIQDTLLVLSFGVVAVVVEIDVELVLVVVELGMHMAAPLEPLGPLHSYRRMK